MFLGLACSSRGDETYLDGGYVLEVELTDFADGLIKFKEKLRKHILSTHAEKPFKIQHHSSTKLGEIQKESFLNIIKAVY